MAHLKRLGGVFEESITLKNKIARKSFTELKIEHNPHDWKKTPSARIRDIYIFRLHVPSSAEREAMNIPESDERIRMNDMHHVMILCGGLVGVHFTSAEIMAIKQYTSELDASCVDLEHFFNSLPGSTKRHQLCDEVYLPPLPRSLSPPLATEVEENTNLPPRPSSSGDNTAASTATDTDLVTLQVSEFHIKADRVQTILRSLQDLVKVKEAMVTVGCDRPVVGEEANGEGNFFSKPRPVWMETLIRKYTEHISQSAMLTAEATSARSSSQSSLFSAAIPAPSVGKFSCFLSCCVTGQIDCSRSEQAAIVELLMASSNHGAGVGQPANWLDEIFSHTQVYWAHRFFDFIKKLPEFKTAIKDEKSLPKFHLYI